MNALLIIFIGAIVTLFLGVNKPEYKLTPLAIFVLLAALGVNIYENFNGEIYSGVTNFLSKNPKLANIEFTKFSYSINSILILTTIFIIAVFGNKSQQNSDLVGLIMFSLCGAMMLTSFKHFVMLFLGIETLSIPLYVLAGSDKHNLRSNESAIKYFLMGAFSTAIFLMGTAFLYGGTGALDIESVQKSIENSVGIEQFAAHNNMHSIGEKVKIINFFTHIGVFMVMLAMCFKIAAFPLHFWSPDVYEGSPTRTTVFMSTVAKIAAFAAFFILFNGVFNMYKIHYNKTIAIISALTIIIGNIAALKQINIKRMLAYSSIAHAGYMCLTILGSNEKYAIEGFMFYALAYSIAGILVFIPINKIEQLKGNNNFEAFSGLFSKNGLLGFALVLGLMSMAGIPLTAGFIGKYKLFGNAITSQFVWVVIAALIGSLISIGYYFKVFKQAIDTSQNNSEKITISWAEKIAIFICIAIIIGIGIFPFLSNYLIAY